MSENLNPTEAQREAMVGVLRERFDVLGFHTVDKMIAAANSIADGAPVGTIARRPDGEWIAVRKAHWRYWAPDGARIADGMPRSDDADSWPVIYSPEAGS
ncbi:Uncharacterised protein [Mycobacteroides abscessus subsp. abscessus]|uniref:Uncharacterized protein n=1 Tax=Mycobacteroides abscessus TaxID=36809 RepID=A0AB33T4A8_9MYCO|nr:hypothetical protein [Mycobacteroides abscessus]MDO3082996.1 hypothetical protein [Mycobacteroides abscessus subsp. abscessus]RIR38494.1 hypothetical protein D2E38_07455 [Mycobacteroides abscessus]RIR38552.1 hypothetical protein D2E36_16995 [Mycobacteroides abscessus]RIS43091.1 hypothetical protein D2E71_16010 [Mycobacteroides abscessus]RIT00696.1 hypothetical protein D2E72_26220 [Mycobacteroides abscessus]